MKRNMVVMMLILGVALLCMVFSGAMCSSGARDAEERGQSGEPAIEGRGTESGRGSGDGAAPSRKGPPAEDFP